MTLVSAFFSNINNTVDKNLDSYTRHGIALLKSTIPKIIFVDNDMYERIKCFENENTKIILSKKSDIYLYDYIDKLENFSVHTNNAYKDTVEFMFIMCSKTEMIRKAIELNPFPFNNDQFIWVDFCIKHVFTCSDEEFIQKINRLYTQTYKKVRIASIWNTKVNISLDIYKDLAWYFAGGVFGGDKESLLSFANHTKEICINVMNEKKTIMWEVNIWFLVFLRHPYLFELYQADHNNTIIDNY
jgi:hypothetical protein